MEQQAMKAARRSGWSEKETNMLWETADEAQMQGLPLKAVFEQIAEKTGRRPNSIRNYYYAQVRRKAGGDHPNARFVPFTEDEVEWLIRQVLIGRSEGMSVRACLQKLSDGDHSLTLRYQNKYRAVLKSKPELVRKIVEELNEEGISCTEPEVNHRTRLSAEEAGRRLTESAYRSGDSDIVRACETITALIDSARKEERFVAPSVVSAVRSFVQPIKNYLLMGENVRKEEFTRFSEEMTSLLGKLEETLPAGSI